MIRKAMCMNGLCNLERFDMLYTLLFEYQTNTKETTLHAN